MTKLRSISISWVKIPLFLSICNMLYRANVLYFDIIGIMGKIFPFRIYAQILIFSALVALGTLILWPLQQAVQGGMIGIRDDLITRLERRIDRKIQYSSISPSLFGSFDVRNVSIMGKDDRPVLTMSRFRIAYSLWDLLRGRPQGIHTVRLDTPFIDLDTARDNDLINLLESLNTGNNHSRRNTDAIFPERLTVQIRNGKCLIIDGRNQFNLDALNCNVGIDGDRIVLDGRWNVGFTVNTLVGTPVNIHALMRLSGSFRTDMEEGEAVLSIPAITGDAISASPIAFGLALEGKMIRLGKMPDQLPVDFWVEYGINGKNIDAHLDCTDFRMGEFVSFSGGLLVARQFLDIAGSGTAFFERKHDGALGYSVNMDGRAMNTGSLPSLAAGASFAINAGGDENRIHIETLQFSMPKTGREDAFIFGNARFSGTIDLNPLAPSGIFSLKNFSLSGVESVNADIGITSRDGDIIITSETLKLGKVELAAFHVLLQPLQDDMDFSVSARHSAGRGSFSLEGSLNSKSRHAQTNIRLDSFTAGDISAMVQPFSKKVSVPPLVAGTLDTTAISTEAFIATDFSSISYNAPRFIFTSRAGKGFSGVVSLNGTDRHFSLNDGRFIRGEDSVSLSLEADFPGSRNMSFSMRTGYRDIAYLVEGTVRGESVTIRGSHGLNVKIAASNNRGRYAGSIIVGGEDGGFPLPFLGHPAYLFCSAQIRYDTAASWSVNLTQFYLENISGPAGLTQVRISGSASQNGITIPLLYYQDNLGPLNGKADLSWTADYSRFTGMAQIADGKETYHVTGSLIDNHGAIVCSGSSMRLDRILGNKVNLLANGNIHMSWDTSHSFRAEFSLPSVNGTLYGQRFGASAQAVLDSRELSISSLNFNFAGIGGTVSRFLINSEQGTAGARTELWGVTGGRPVAGSMAITANFTPLRSWLEINEIIHAVDGKLQVESLRYGSGESQTFDIAFSRHAGSFSVLGGPRDMIRFRMDQGGNFYAGLSSPFPVRGTLVGSVSQKTINARCGDLYIDMAELFNILPESKDIYLTGGYVNAAVDIRGSLTDPEFFGSARGTSLRVNVPGFVTNELRPIPFTIVFDGNEARFGPVATVAGNGGGMVSGWFRFDRWIPNIFRLDLAVPRETPIPYGIDINGFTARGDAFGNFTLAMEDLAFAVSGNLYANNTEMGINSDEMARAQGADSFSSAPFPFTVNLTVSTGPVVEFTYPNSRFPILRANPDIGSRIHITANSLTRQYSITSDIKIRGGEIFYFERSFYIRSGTLTFRENERNFDPRLTARAEVRDRTGDGPVTISMIVDNAPLLSFSARFESSPPLSQMEILTMLGQNMAGTQFNENTDAAQRALISSVSDFATQFLVIQQLERQIRTFTRLDMFSVRTQVLQNAFFMASGMTAQPVDRTVSVGNYFDNTTVLGGKYIGQDMFVSGMLSMRYDANKASLVTVAPDIGIEMQNPLFSIRWDFNPIHPENWYVNDNSITLTKTFTF
jgi:hypothetical protein